MWPFKTNFESHNKNKTLFYDASNDGAMKAARLNHEITFFFQLHCRIQNEEEKKVLPRDSGTLSCEKNLW